MRSRPNLVRLAARVEGCELLEVDPQVVDGQVRVLAEQPRVRDRLRRREALFWVHRQQPAYQVLRACRVWLFGVFGVWSSAWGGVQSASELHCCLIRSVRVLTLKINKGEKTKGGTKSVFP